MKWFSSLVVTSLLLENALASLFNHHEALGMACALAAQDLFTTCAQEDYGCFCASDLYVYAVENCISRESHHNSTMMGLAFDNFELHFCESHNSHANTTNVWSAENQAVNPSVTQKAYNLAYDGEKNNLSQKEVSVWLGVGLIFYWVLIASMVTFLRLLREVNNFLFASRMVMRRASKPERFLQKYIIWPAMFKYRHMDRFNYLWGFVNFSLPTRMEGIIVTIYIVLVIIFMLTPYTFMNNDPLFSSRWKEMMRYASDRSGILATVQFPMLILFALRNNILIWITGWSFATFNTYHRAVARVTYLLLIVHAVMKHIFSLSYGGSMTKYYYPVPYFRWGCAAMGLFSLMILMAVFRSRGYEFFYRLHQLMAIGGIICSIFHLNGIGFKTPLWISITLWGADWTLRVLRILLFNVNFFLPPLPGARKSSFAFARLYSDSLLKLTITTPVRWVCRPGQYVYLHTNQWTFIGGHPFSVLGSSETGEGLELVVAARQGMTSRLRTALEARSCSPNYPVTIPVYVEGPYGHSINVQCYDEGLFFAGGIGITGVVGYIESMVKSNQRSRFPKKITLFWSVRHRSHIDPVSARLAELGSESGVQIRIFQVQKLVAPVSPETGEIEQPLEFTDVPFSQYYELESLEKGVQMADVGLGGKYINEMETTIRPSSSEANKMLQLPQDTEKRASQMAAASLHSRRFSHKRTKSGKFQHVRQKSRDVRKSIMEIIKPVATDEDDDFDYGKDEFLETHSRHSKSVDLTPPSPTTPRNSRGYRIRMSAIVSDRQRSSRFIAAGFTDQPTERVIVDSSNPFEDNKYRIFEVPSSTQSVVPSNLQVAARDLHKLIEPVRMNIPELIQSYLSNSDGSVCVVGCGPDKMMDTLRWSCCKLLDYAKNGRVDYYEEAFSY